MHPTSHFAIRHPKKVAHLQVGYFERLGSVRAGTDLRILHGNIVGIRVAVA